MASEMKYALAIKSFSGNVLFVGADDVRDDELSDRVLMTRDQMLVQMIRLTAEGNMWQHWDVLLVRVDKK